MSRAMSSDERSSTLSIRSGIKDEALLAERIGARVRLVRGSPLNIKITTREDLALGELLLKLRAEDGSE